jgi:uncharacterized protein
LRKIFFSSLILLTFCACATERYLGVEGHAAFARRDWQKASESFAQKASQEGTNQLLFMLDQAVSLFNMAQYEEAIAIFLEAEKLAEIKDYTSISEELGVLGSGQNVRGYKGEDFEKVLINVYLAMAFAAMGNFESAQVECRKINLLLNKMVIDGKRNYQESAFARYLSAVLWEASGEWNSAYIDYKLAYELDPELSFIASDLIYTAKKARLREYEMLWRNKYSSAPLREDRAGYGELIVFYHQGLSPRKVPRHDNAQLPRFVKRSSDDTGAQVWVNDSLVGQTQTLLDVEDVSIRYLEDRIGRLMAAQVAGLAVKAGIGYGVAKATKSDDLGVLAFYAMMLSDRADLRSWLSLPASIQVLRVSLPVGTHSVRLEVQGAAGKTIRSIEWDDIEIASRQKVFRVGR